MNILSLALTISLISLSQSFSPPDSIAINCGSPSPLSQNLQSRSWHGDTHLPNSSNPNFTLTQTHNSFTNQSQTQPTDRIPYFTARLSLNPFSYLFSLSSLNPVFVRLHFYPDSYGSFNPSQAFFGVTVNQFTLLSNFSPSLSASHLGKDCIVREYCLIPQSNTLNLTFAPSDSMPDSFAFVNGIEIVSVPAGLYYGSDRDQGFTFIGNEVNRYTISNDTALELAHRLNVGGSFILPVDDTGMFREWELDDKYYNAIGALPEDVGSNLNWSKTVPNYTAPDAVYLTARSMGKYRTQNEEYNLTWNLAVDSGFNYWLRLHFCEFQPEIQVEGDRQFIIYIQNQTAEEEADVIKWSGGQGVPVYRDYAVNIMGEDKEKNLRIDLHPSPKQDTKYSDVILNGVEVFKLSNPGASFAARNPDPTPSEVGNTLPKRESGHVGLIAGVSVGVTLVLLVGLILGFLVFRRGRSTKDAVSNASVESGSSGGLSPLPADLCRHFSIAEIRAATKDFDEVFIIGRGGFGDVYKGRIEGMDSAVAIKRLNPGLKQGAPEFMTEIEMLFQLRHVHLVSLIGYCNDEREMILVYDFMPCGTLRDHLYGSDNPPLSWKQRLQICIGAAKGLHYLHTGMKRMIVHRNVKTTNILLDDKFVAKVSDFGLLRMNQDKTTNTHISTAVKGSFGYLDSEYYRCQQLTEKSDVYSFGVVLFEVLCARPAIDKSFKREQISLASWAWRCYDNGTIHQIVDPYLTGRIAPDCLKKFVEIVVSCLEDEGIQRPSMNDLVWNLEFALQLQDSVDRDNKAADIEHRPSDFCRRFSLSEILSATHSFSDAMLIGRGGFGNVYKGLIDNGTTIVAIKRLNPESKQGAGEFWTEVMTLYKLRHRNLINLIGYSEDDEEMILVYDFMTNGTLADHLYNNHRKGKGENVCHLTWKQRLDICIGAARGLDYLHEGTEQSVIHRDMKTTNILLDENWVPKISDFGLSKMGAASHTQTHLSTDVKGTFGYLDPQYFLTRRLTKKSDVYAFGVVLCEVLCGRPPVDFRVEDEQCSLAMWVQQCMKKEIVAQIVDPSLSGQISNKSLKVFAEVTNRCLHSHPKERPTMSEVKRSLELALASGDKTSPPKGMITCTTSNITRIVVEGFKLGRRS